MQCELLLGHDSLKVKAGRSRVDVPWAQFDGLALSRTADTEFRITYAARPERRSSGERRSSAFSVATRTDRDMVVLLVRAFHGLADREVASELLGPTYARKWSSGAIRKLKSPAQVPPSIGAPCVTDRGLRARRRSGSRQLSPNPHFSSRAVRVAKCIKGTEGKVARLRENGKTGTVRQWELSPKLSHVSPIFLLFPFKLTHFLYISQSFYLAISHNSPFPPFLRPPAVSRPVQWRPVRRPPDRTWGGTVGTK